MKSLAILYGFLRLNHPQLFQFKTFLGWLWHVRWAIHRTSFLSLKRSRMGWHWTKMVDTRQYQAMLDNNRQYITIMNNIWVFLSMWQIRQDKLKLPFQRYRNYWTILGNSSNIMLFLNFFIVTLTLSVTLTVTSTVQS